MHYMFDLQNRSVDLAQYILSIDSIADNPNMCLHEAQLHMPVYYKLEIVL